MDGLGLEGFQWPISVAMIAKIVGILLFLWIALYVVKKSRFQAGGRFFSERSLKILESKPLGNRQFLLVVGYQQEKFLLGVYPNGMQFLCRLQNGCEDFSFGEKKNPEKKKLEKLEPFC